MVFQSIFPAQSNTSSSERQSAVLIGISASIPIEATILGEGRLFAGEGRRFVEEGRRFAGEGRRFAREE
jgi:hypothetical protein